MCVQGWYEHALADDPYGAVVLTEAAGFYVRTGRPDRAVDLLESFESLRSPKRGVWEIAGRIYLSLGLEARADHAALCAAAYPDGCLDAP